MRDDHGTAQQARIEQDLHTSLEKLGLNKSEPDMRAYSEMLIRNYDPAYPAQHIF